VVSVTPTAASLGFEPNDVGFLTDPYPVYARMREEPGLIHYERNDWWLASRHADIDAMLRHRQLGRVFVPKQPYERFAPWNLVNEHAMLEMEPPDHTRLRKLVSHAFTPRRVEALRDRVREMVDELIDGLLDAGGGDLLHDLAEPLPVAVISELLGIEGDARELLRPWSNAIVALYEPEADASAEDAAITAAREFTEYLDVQIAQRRDTPGEDLLSALVQLQVEGDRLTRDEVVATAVLLLNAGHEASVNVMGNGVVAMLREGEWDRLVADPSIAPTAVEEAIRFDMPLSVFTRTVMEDVTVGDHELREGQVVGLLLASANRDPAAFPDADRMDISRAPNPHVGFGAGIHFCLGAALARVELQEAFTRLATRVPQLSLASEPPRRRSYQFRGYTAVPVTTR
jgi:cytochrome P450